MDNKYNTGDVVICIDANVMYNLLTYGRMYTITSVNTNNSLIWVINDRGENDYFRKYRFISVKEYRDSVISEILI
mgnify:CR=1 FL=1